MRIAVPYDFQTRAIFSLFVDTPYFRIYEVEDGKAGACRTVMTVARGHVALADLLQKKEVSDLICGNIDGEAVNFLQLEGIKVHAGIAGDPDVAVNKLLAGTLPELDVTGFIRKPCSLKQNGEDVDCEGDCDSCAGCE